MMKAKPMQKVKTFLEKTPNALLCVLGAVVFLAGFYFLTSRTPLNKIWLPTTMNNDEVLYNRQVVSVITHGGHLGLRAAGLSVRQQRQRGAVVQPAVYHAGHCGVCPQR